MLLEKVASPAEVQKELSPLAKEGKLGSKGKEVLQRVLVANLGSQEKADAYYAALMFEVREAARKELEKKMINEDAATFKLKNLKGEDVSLASLKGKVVVLDFWATWCGPCIQSFPGMQKTIDKYKNNENVV
ncbi:MAG: TlpA family protein disulfide reductase, partial [Chryseobacterium sp.]